MIGIPPLSYANFLRDLQNKPKDINFLQDLAFLTDIIQHLNILNLQLQGENEAIFQMISLIDDV